MSYEDMLNYKLDFLDDCKKSSCSKVIRKYKWFCPICFSDELRVIQSNKLKLEYHYFKCFQCNFSTRDSHPVFYHHPNFNEMYWDLLSNLSSTIEQVKNKEIFRLISK